MKIMEGVFCCLIIIKNKKIKTIFFKYFFVVFGYIEQLYGFFLVWSIFCCQTLMKAQGDIYGV